MRGRLIQVSAVTPQAQKRIVLLEEIISNGPVRIMTDTAIFGYRRVFKDKRPLKFCMAVVAEVIDRAPAHISLLRAMNVMTAAALHFPLPQGMVGRETHLSLLFAVARITEICLLSLE
jgi:hypothetical protein